MYCWAFENLSTKSHFSRIQIDSHENIKKSQNHTKIQNHKKIIKTEKTQKSHQKHEKPDKMVRHLSNQCLRRKPSCK